MEGVTDTNVIIPVLYRAKKKFRMLLGGWKRATTGTNGSEEVRIVGTYTDKTPFLIEEGDQVWCFPSKSKTTGGNAPTHFFKIKKSNNE